MWHDTGSGAGPLSAGGWVQPGVHSENPETKRRLRNLPEVSGLYRGLTQSQPEMASREELLRFHTPEYLDRLERLSAPAWSDLLGCVARRLPRITGVT